MSVPVALLGCGGIAPRHLDSIQRAGTLSLAGVFDVQRDRAAEAAATFSAPRVYASLEEVLADPDVAAIDICLPHHLHCDVAVQALEAGKHVVVEKPMSVSVAEADAMIAAAERAGRTLMPGHTKVFMPEFEHLAELVASGDIGTVHTVKSNLVSGPEGLAERRWWTAASGGGGVGMGQSIHHAYALRRLLGDATEVAAMAGTLVVEDMDSEDTLVMLVRFARGTLGEMTSALGSRAGGQEERLALYGSEGFAEFVNGRVVVVCPARFGDDEPHEVTFDYEGAGTPIGWWEFPFLPMLEEFGRSIEEGRPPRVTAEDGRAAVELIEAGYRSAREGGFVHLPLA